MNAAIAVEHPGRANLLDPLCEAVLAGETGLVVIGGFIEQEHTTCPPDRDIPVATQLINELALADRPQSFRRNASCSISLSRLRSATTFRSLLFSSSSCLSRRAAKKKSVAMQMRCWS